MLFYQSLIANIIPQINPIVNNTSVSTIVYQYTIFTCCLSNKKRGPPVLRRAQFLKRTPSRGGKMPASGALNFPIALRISLLQVKICVGRDYWITLNFRCKLQCRSSYSHSTLFAHPFGHHSRNEYLITL